MLTPPLNGNEMVNSAVELNSHSQDEQVMRDINLPGNWRPHERP